MLWDWIKAIKEEDYLTRQDFKTAVKSMDQWLENANSEGHTTKKNVSKSNQTHTYYITYKK